MNIYKILADRQAAGAIIALAGAVQLYLDSVNKDLDDAGEIITVTPLLPMDEGNPAESASALGATDAPIQGVKNG